MKKIFVLVHGVMGIQEGYSDTDFEYYTEVEDAISKMDAHVSSYLSNGYELKSLEHYRAEVHHKSYDSQVLVAIYCIEDYIEGTSYNWFRFQQETGFPYDYYIKPDEDMYRVRHTMWDRNIMEEVINLREMDISEFNMSNELDDIAMRLAGSLPFMVDMPDVVTYFSPIAQIK